jgi:hypothetical protein
VLQGWQERQLKEFATPNYKDRYESPCAARDAGAINGWHLSIRRPSHDASGAAVAVTALREFMRICRICRASGHLLPYRSRHSRQLAPGIHVYDPDFCGLLRHSCDPNVFLDMSELWLWSLKDIHKGDSLTMDYVTTEDKLLQQFACQCGTPNCRGWITGYDEPPNAEGMLFLQRRHRRTPG